MAKTKEELNTIKKEYEALTAKLKELNDEELKQVTGGAEEHNVMVGAEDHNVMLTAEQKEFYVG